MKRFLILTTLFLFPILLFGQSWPEFQKTLPIPVSGGDDQFFGHAVEIDGNYAVIGAHGVGTETGIAYVYFYDGASWSKVATLEASDAAIEDRFGWAVGISGDVVVVGSYWDDDNGNATGAVYVFEKPVSGWTDMNETAKLLASDGNIGDYLGISVSIDGDYIAAGASGKETNGISSGAVYVYEKPLTGWANGTETAKLLASDGYDYDQLGFSVHISGDNIVAGAHGEDALGSSAGAAYVFTKPGGGWVSGTETQKLTAADGVADDNFGQCVSISGPVIVIGSEGDDDAGSYSGSAYVFEYTGTWLEHTKLVAPDAAFGDHFGVRVDVSGDRIVVGAKNDDDVAAESGSTYTFSRIAATWVSTGKLTASDAAVDDNLGRGVAVSGDKVLVGAVNDDSNGNNSGSVYFFLEPVGGWVSMTQTQKIGADYLSVVGNLYGRSVAIDGNYAVVGADGASSSSGVAYVLYFDGSSWTTQATLTATGISADEFFGYDVDISGDNIVVGAYRDNPSGLYSGSAFVYTKPGAVWTDMTQTAKLTASDGAISDYFARSVAISGDVVVVGAPDHDAGGGNTGAGYVYVKPGGGWVDAFETAKLTTSVVQDGRKLGFASSIDGDDIILSGYGDDQMGNNAGAAFVYSKPGGGWTSMTETAKLTASDGLADDQFAWSVAISGNTIVCGVPNDDVAATATGSAYVYSKPGAAWVTATETAKLQASDVVSWDFFGYSVSVDGDNVVVASRYDDDNGSNSGSAYYFKKPAGGWTSTTEDTKLIASDGAALDYFGEGIDISGDFILVGAMNNDGAGPDAGAAYFFKQCPESTNTLNETACDSYTSPSGNYTWTTTGTYMDTIPNACGSDSVLTINLTIDPLDDASFNYTATEYCFSSTDETPTITGLGGGSFSSTPAGLNLNPATGEIIFSSSSAGVYTVTYTTAGTCPNSSDVIIDLYTTDTDGDGLLDCDEIDVYGTDPFVYDTDGDGLNDGLEVNVGGTDPLDADTDNDGLCDGPNSVGGNCLGGEDINANGIVDAGETDPLNDDTDGDLCGDASDPNPVTYSPDTDGDGLGNDCDLDDDNDGVEDLSDAFPYDPQYCQDLDGDGCDDCSGNPYSTFSPVPWMTYTPDPSNDGTDTDGDGLCDAGDPDDDNDGCLDGGDPAPLVYSPDPDGDGIGDDCDQCWGNDVTGDADGDGYCSDTDCDDGDPNEFPGQLWYPDCDGDGYFSATPVSSCTMPSAAMSPCGDGNAPDGGYTNTDPGALADCDDEDAGIFPGTTWFQDFDNDGYGDASSFVTSCTAPPGYVLDNTDCNDNDDSIYPGAPEIVDDGIDQDCNGFDAITCYQDSDQDGYGDNIVVIADDESCDVAQNESYTNTDCNDADATIYPGAPEVVDDGIDQDCNGFDAVTCYQDSDQDGYGDVIVVIADDESCDVAQNESPNDLDCDDSDDQVNPGMTEVTCDGIDNDCNPLTEDAPDVDNDGYSICAGDCDDGNDQINPGMSEYGCNGIDDDCNPATLDVITIDVSTTSSGMLIVANNAGGTYQWVDCTNGNTPIAGATNQTYLATVGGEYAVIITEDDCADTSDCVFVSDVGIDETGQEFIALYPNPTSDILKIEFEGEITDLIIQDLSGRELIVPMDLENGRIDLSMLEPSDYIVTILTAAGNKLIRKISVVR